MSKVAIVTGAASGLGLNISNFLLLNDYKVYGISRTKRNWKSAVTLTKNKNFILKNIDLKNEESISKYYDDIFNCEKRIDVLINNAGYVHPLTRLEDTTKDELMNCIHVNFLGTFYSCKYGISKMLKQKKSDSEPTIINISSMAGVRSVPMLGVYSACKKAITGLSEAMAKENYGNIRCITISPSGMDTPTRAFAYGKKDAEKQQNPKIIAEIIWNIINGTIPISSGSDIAIRNETITAVHKSPDI